jgi:hypothetical protein
MIRIKVEGKEEFTLRSSSCPVFRNEVSTTTRSRVGLSIPQAQRLPTHYRVVVLTSWDANAISRRWQIVGSCPNVLFSNKTRGSLCGR